MKLLLISLLAVGSVSIANEEEFAKHKAEMVSQIDKQIAALGDHKACVSAATNGEALKVCHEKMKQHRSETREEMRNKKMGRMDERMKKLEEKKSKLEEKK